ncbi:MAG TPA: hypothetical protein VHL78_11935 [Actinomycetota bacterium]|nr:hypothetical protein [Actinomycetota bacterium]
MTEPQGQVTGREAAPPPRARGGASRGARTSAAHAPRLYGGPPDLDLSWAAIPELEARITAAVIERVDEATAAGTRALAESLGRALTRLGTSVQQGVQRAFRQDIARLVEELDAERAEMGERLEKLEWALSELASGDRTRDLATREELERAVATFHERAEEIRGQSTASLEELRSLMASMPNRDQLEERLGAMDSRLAEVDQARGMAIEGGLDRLRDEVDRQLRGLAEGLEQTISGKIPSLEGIEAKLDEVAERVPGEAQSFHDRMARLEAGIGEQFARLATEIEEERASLPGRIQEIVAEVATREQLEMGLAQMESRLAERNQARIAAIERGLGAVAEELDRQLRVLVERIEERVSAKIPRLEGLETRLDQLAEQRRVDGEALARLEAAVTERIAGLASGVERLGVALPARMEDIVEELSRRLDGISSRTEAAMGAIPDQVRGVEAEVRGAIDGVHGELRSALSALQEKDTAVAREAADRLAGLDARISDVAASVRTGLEEAGQAQSVVASELDRRIREAGERLGELVETVASSVPERQSTERALADLGAQLEELAGTVAGLGSRSELEAALLERIPDRDRVENGLARLGAMMRRLEESAATSVAAVTAVERSVGERLQKVQAALAQRVGAVSDEVSRRMSSVEERASAAVVASLAGADRAMTDRVEALFRPELDRALSAAVEGFRGDLRAAMTGRPEARDLQDAIRMQKKFERAVAGMRGELDRLSKVVSTFGKPRMAPRLAQEIRALERRLDNAEKGLGKDVASLLEARIGPLEDRVESLVQRLRDEVRAIDLAPITAAVAGLDRRVREATERDAEEQARRSRFRRRS